MTPTEFLHYLSGFAEACGEHPTKEQWSRILEGLNATLAKANGVSPIARPNNPPALGDAPHLRDNAMKLPYVNPKEKWPTKIDAAPTFTLRDDGPPINIEPLRKRTLDKIPLSSVGATDS